MNSIPPGLTASATIAFAVALTSVLVSAQTQGQAQVQEQGRAQTQAPAAGPVLLDAPRIFDSTHRGAAGRLIPGPKFRVVPTNGLKHPFALAFLPDGTILITERAGQLRAVRNGTLDPKPIAGIPPVAPRGLQGLNDIAIHPKFAENRWVYLTYYKPDPAHEGAARAVLARGTLSLPKQGSAEAAALTDVRDIFITDKVTDAPSVTRMVFGRDGKIYLVVGGPILNAPPANPAFATPNDAQEPGSYFGKVLRLNDDGTAPPDNPFAGKPGYQPEIYVTGIRNAMSIEVHPVTGEIWLSEHGPQGGDEINILKPGANYGWPTVSFGRSYSGEPTGGTGPSSRQPVAPGIEAPWLFWSPSVGPSGMAFYTGDRFPDWKGSIFVGTLVGGYLERIVLNPQGFPIRQDRLLAELNLRIREVRQGPDGNLYLLTDEEAGSLLRLEPVSAGS